MGNISQGQLAQLFTRSQTWVSKQQRRQVDPMPRDLAGASDWGRKHGYLPGGPANDAQPAGNGAQLQFSGVEAVDIKLKEAKRRKIEMDTERAMGELVPLSDVEAREARNAAEFRRVACEYPARARAVIERHVPEPLVVEKIMEDLKPLAADLLNRSDANKTLAGLTRDQLRALLLARVEQILEATP